MAISLPNPGMVFVPLDVLTAEELNQIVQNIDTLAELFPLKAAQIGANAIGTNQLSNAAVTAPKLDWSAFCFTEATDTTQTTIGISATNLLYLDVSNIPSGAKFIVMSEYVFNGASDDIVSVVATLVYGSVEGQAMSHAGTWDRTINSVQCFTKVSSQNRVYLQAYKDKSAPPVYTKRGYMCAFRVG